MNVILLSLIVALFWAINPIIIKTVLKNTSFPLILLLSNLTSFTAVILFSFLNKNNILNDWKKMETKDMYLIITNTLIFGFTATLLYLYLLKNNDVNLIIGLTYMSPIFAIILSKYILKENVTHLAYFGILFIVIGGVLISQSISKK